MLNIRILFSRFSLAWQNPLGAFCLSFLIYFAIAFIGGAPFGLKATAYYNYLADAFLHGQYYLRIIPPTTHDLSFFNGNYFLYWPPMPALVLMPFVAVFGIGFSDIFFTVVIASINVMLVAHLLNSAEKAQIINITRFQKGILVLFFAAGTVHLILAPRGGVWFTGQLTGFMFVILSYIFALHYQGVGGFVLTGTAIGLAMLTRNHLLFAGIWPAYYLVSQHWHQKKKLAGYVLAALLPPLFLGLWFLSYNFARFGSFAELGIQYHQMADFFRANYDLYGTFHIAYLPINLYYQYLFYPLPLSAETFQGGSLFMLSPVFFVIFPVVWKELNNNQVRILATTVLVVMIPILLLMGTGWVQYGPRYTLDFTVPLILLTARGLKYISNRVLVLLTLISVSHYVIGTIIFIKYAN